MPGQRKTAMQITVRLYRQHDMDLVGLYRTKDFKFQRCMKNALKAYADGKDYKIEHPGDEDIKKGYVPKIVQMHIYLNPKTDQSSIEMLKTIREGYRGAFLKALFRKCLSNEPLAAYKNRKDLIFNAEEDYLESPADHDTIEESKKESANGQKYVHNNDPHTKKPQKSKNGKEQNYQSQNNNRHFQKEEKDKQEYRDQNYQSKIKDDKKKNENFRKDGKSKHESNIFPNISSETIKNGKTNQVKKDIIENKAEKSSNGYNKPFETREYTSKMNMPDDEFQPEFSLFDQSDIPMSAMQKKNEEIKDESEESDSEIPFSFFDDPSDSDDADQLLAQMNNLAH